MEGAREYTVLFRTGQYGRLFIVCGSHTRGQTFHIYVLPEGVEIDYTQLGDVDYVEVYGVVCGCPGWTERYGWLYEGPWQNDFQALVVEKTKAREQRHQENQRRHQEELDKIEARKRALLATYK